MSGEVNWKPSPAVRVLAGLCLVLLWGAFLPVYGRSGADAAAGRDRTDVTPGSAEGEPVVELRIELRGAEGQVVEDEGLRQRVGERFGLTAGELFRPMQAETGLGRVRALPDVSSAEFQLFRSERVGGLVAELQVTLLPEGVERPKTAAGLLHSGELGDLPVLHQSDRALLKLILNGGVGAYGVSNPFFGKSDVFLAGSPIAKDPPRDGSAWWEWYVEPGIGGITQVGTLPLYVYGAATYLYAQSQGQDIYNSYSRGRGGIEKAYAGFLYDLPGKGSVLDVSAGRQNYQLRQGFLISKIPGSTNIGRLGGLQLGPRLAFEKTVVARAKLGRFMAEGIFLEPTEYEEIPNSNTRVAGGTLQYDLAAKADIGFTYLETVNSDGAYLMPDGSRLSPEGVRTYNGSLWARSLLGVDGLWLKSEYAYQDNRDYPMAAQAGYGWIGYDSGRLPWRPSLGYRYAAFTGDDPDTARMERFDPLFSGGQQNFVPGMIMNAVTKNANLITHRVRASVKPVASLEIVLDYFRFRADELNNYGAISRTLWELQSKRLADEVDLSAFWSVSNNFYLQLLAAVAIPDDGIELALGGDLENWYTLQAALYFFF